MSVVTHNLKTGRGFVPSPPTLGPPPSVVDSWLLRELANLSLVRRKAPGCHFPGAFLLASQKVSIQHMPRLRSLTS